MMKKTLLLLGAMAEVTLAAAIDFEQIPAAAQWYLHADVEGVRKTGVGGELREMIEEDAGKKLKAMTRLFAFDPMEDLQSLTLFGKGEQAVILIEGEFDREHLEDLIGGADGHESSEYEGLTIHTWQDAGKIQHGVFIENGLVAVSEHRKHLKHALDVLGGRKDSMEDAESDGSPLMMGLANLSEMEIEVEDMEILKEAESMTVRMDENDEEMVVSLEIVTEDTRVAKRMRRMIDGLLAMVEASIPNIDDYEVESEVELDEEKTAVLAMVKMPSDSMIDFLEHLDALEKN